MSGHWQQYPPDQNGYGYQGYQGQYPQQHQQQQYGPQQYGPPQGPYPYAPPQQDPAYQAQAPYGQYPQGYQQPPQQQQPPPQPPQPARSGHIARPSPNTCYNCGSPDHWAMNCPEPRRGVPHGQVIDSMRGKRKFSSRPPVIIKYDVPGSMGQQQPMPPQGYGGQGPPPGGYQQYPAPHHQPPQGQMPGPMPGQGPSQAQPPQPYPQQYPGPDPQGQWHGHDQHPQWQGQYPQGQYPGPAHGDQHAGPPHQGQWQRQQTYSQGPEYSQPPSTSSAPYQDPQQYAPPPSYPTPSSQPTSAVSAVPPSDFGAKPLAKPPTSSQERRESIPTSQRAASVDMARSQSRQSMNDSVSMESESEEEDENAPMDLSKLDIPDVPRGYPGIESRPPCLVGQPLPALLDSDQKDALQPPTAESKGHVQSRYINAGNLEYTLKNARNKYDFKENQDDPVFLPIREPTPPPVVEPRSERRGNGYYRGGDRPEPHLRRSRSPSNSRRFSYRHNHAPPPPPPSQPPYQQTHQAPKQPPFQGPYPQPEEPPRSATPVYKPESKRRPRNFDPFEPDSEDVPPPVEEPYTEWGRYDLNGPPPPPPGNPPRHFSSAQNGNPFAASPTNGQSRYGGAQSSPTKAHPDHRKRRHGEDADEDDGKARRQRDDYTPKHKRNAPKVADAYSRRW